MYSAIHWMHLVPNTLPLLVQGTDDDGDGDHGRSREGDVIITQHFKDRQTEWD